MTAPPDRPRIFHITHVENCPGILAEECLLSDRRMLDRSGPKKAIGISDIKRRRIERLTVSCHPGTHVGDFVPFYFCPRSVMLYVISRRNHPELPNRDGYEPIVHLEADLHTVVRCAGKHGVRWAISDGNAGAAYTDFYAGSSDLAKLDWKSVASTDFREAAVKQAKQSEFLIHDRFPFDLVERVGVKSPSIQARVAALLAAASHQPPVEVRREWYF